LSSRRPAGKSVLLHICCGVCAFACIESLQSQGFTVRGLFFNPNIHPQEEYLKRSAAAARIADVTGIKTEEGPYVPKFWQDACAAYKDEREGGRRCRRCYELRLARTLSVCRKQNFDYFTSTLTVSPHKDSRVIFEIGERLDKDKFLACDFKKKDGFKKTIQAARKFNLYRQKYCGCVYSIKKPETRG